MDTFTNSPAMMDICKDTAKIALSQASVLISGESGTGKELIARAIHYNSRRAKGPFIKVNCAALPESLLESELFGHEKGAFTGAQTLRQGLFERANEGICSLTKLAKCRWYYKPNYYAFYRNGNLNGLAAIRP